MSSCLSGSGRTYGFDLDIVKPLSSSSASARSFRSSTSSALSETCNSSRTTSVKKARTPRKRPNQALNEAAALLSTVYPNVFSAGSTLKKLSKDTALPLDPFRSEFPELLPSFPILVDAAFLIRESPPEQQRLQQPSAFRFELKPLSPSKRPCGSSSSSLESPGSSSPVLLDDDFDTETILDGEVEESIDSIMGNLSMNADTGNNKEESGGKQMHINLYLRSLICLRTGGKYDFGLRLRYNRSMQQALRHRDEGEWWRIPTVPVGNIVPQFKPAAAPSMEEKKKTKKKKVLKKRVLDDVQQNAAGIITDSSTATDNATTTTTDSMAPALGLRLKHEEVLKAWSGCSMFSDGPGSPDSSADVLAKLADVDLCGDDNGAGGAREAISQRYKEKKRGRLSSKKIRY